MAERLQPIGFWSYTSSDDRNSDGRLSELRKLLAQRLQLLVGQRPPVQIFQDVAAIQLGSDWSQKIDEALEKSSFLIPIVTPGFLQSKWCSKEVMRFREREEALGRNDLIFPFHYVGIDHVDPNDPDDCHDPAVFSLLASRQRFDFTPWVSHDPKEREVVAEVAKLATAVRNALRAGQARRVDGAVITPARQPPAAANVQVSQVEAATPSPAVSRVFGERSAVARGADAPPYPPPPPLTRWRDRIPGLPEDVCPEMITLPAGRFTMGAPESEAESLGNERPQRQVTVTSFALGRCAVTFAQWDAAREAGADLPHPKDAGWGRGDLPVINVSWEDAQDYCAWLNERLGLTMGGYRLPSEAEWEYACRAGSTTPFSFGATISTDQVNYNGNYTYGHGRKGEYRERTVPVGSLPANAWGMYEMHGNVSEWCEDWYGPYPDYPTDAGPLRHVSGTRRVRRGGSWGNNPGVARAANRVGYYFGRGGRSALVGFRVARTPGSFSRA